ncbi:MAG: hypothetical protein CSA50_05165 [Gammaproteobacteria bacterium]|nr:MAG: hypothetical protein CSA50_05165 [Gammaproteobacteria bacterium]
MRVVVVRHYKTQFNKTNKIMGWGNSPPAKGWVRDLVFVKKKLEQNALGISTVYTSDLERAKRTGIFLAQQLGIKNHPVIHSAGLNEINYGALFEKDKSWVEKMIPQHKKDPDFVYPEGESFRQMQKRSVDFLDSLAKKHQDNTILLVVHAGIIRGFIAHYLDLPYAPCLKMKTTHRYIGYYRFNGKDNRFVQYTELGQPSQFVKDRIICVPHTATSKSGQPRYDD